MRGAFRLLAVSALLVLGAVFASSAQAAGGPALAAGGAAPLASPFAAGAMHPFITADAAPLQNGSFGGQTTFATGTSSVSTTFHVPKIADCTSDSGFAPGAFIFAGPTTAANLDAAGVIDQCISGTRMYVAALVIDNLETNFTDTAHKIKSGDVMTATTSVGASGSSATLSDVTKGWTVNLTGSDSASDEQIVGNISTSFNGVSEPISNPGGASFTASTVNGTAMGTQSPFKINMVNGCQILMTPSGFDSATHEAFKVSAPHIAVTSVSPGSGTAGTAVTIDGFGFNSTSGVKFGAGAATAVTHTSATAMTATVPTTATTGPITITNTAAPKGSGVSACVFTVAPKITSFTPASGVTGSQVTITGSGFKGTTAVKTVKFGSKAAASFTVVSATQIKATVPNGAATGPITVISPAGTAVSATNFTPTLSITEIKPTSGPVGTTVAITGVGFNSSSTVSFGGVAGTGVKVVSGTVIHANVPAGLASGTVAPVTVKNTTAPVGTVQAQKSFTVTPSIAPTISSFTPTSGPVGTSVTITGAHFSGAKAVKFNGVAAPSITIVSDTSIKATVPTGATTGPISVTTAAGTGTSSTNFTVS
jgi:large repetitive protein